MEIKLLVQRGHPVTNSFIELLSKIDNFECKKPQTTFITTEGWSLLALTQVGRTLTNKHKKQQNYKFLVLFVTSCTARLLGSQSVQERSRQEALISQSEVDSDSDTAKFRPYSI